ncbi:MAG: hypothetical protein RLY93_13725 [Sumerlaeia bacterium]
MTDPDQEAANNRLAMKMLRRDISRVLFNWDPLCMRGLKNGELEYAPYVGPIAIMVKKGAQAPEIARHLDDLLRDEWKLPRNNQACMEAAEKIFNAGAIFRGE